MAKFGAKSEPEGKDNRRRRDSAKRRSVLIGLAVASLIAGLAGLLTALFYYGGSQRNARQQAVISPQTANTQHPVPVVRSNSKNGTAIGKSARPSGPAVLSKAWIKSVGLPRGTFLAYVPFSQPLLKAVRMARHYRISKAYLPWPGNPWAAPPPVERSLRGVALAKMPFRRDMSGYAAMMTKPPSVATVMALTTPLYLPHHAYVPWPNGQVAHLSCPAKFITCMTWDRFRHSVWIGTEGHGVYEYRPWAPRGKRWLQYSKSNGLSDNSCYGIAVDDKARVWAGTGRHGVDVFISRNKPWQRYDVLPLVHKGSFGPLGSHPFCIALDPYTQAVWLGTEAGISIYSTRKHRWHYLTVANGLPSDQINAIGFLPEGKVIVGTQCEGLDVGTPASHRPFANTKQVLSALPGFRDPYRWRVITGPFHTPDSATGGGLPSSLINAISIPIPGSTKARLSAYQLARAARHEKIYVGTDSGLAVSRNGGASWRFEQGRDYAPRVLGLFHPPAGFRAPPQAQLANLLSGEHITCTARDAAGNLWLGFWRDGYMVISPHGRHIYRTAGDPHLADVGSYVQAILPLPNGRVLIGSYGHGVSVINPQTLAGWRRSGKQATPGRITRPGRMLRPAMVGYPKPAAIPTVQQIIALRNALVKVKPDDPAEPEVIPLDDDWRTRGNWIDHYGRMWSLQYSMTGLDTGGGYDDVCSLRSDAWVNTHWRNGEAARHWLAKGWRNSTDPRTLQDLFHGGRTQASDDDHGEAYSSTVDGPNLYQTIGLPVGDYIFSVYLLNDDGHRVDNRTRDYTLQVSDTPELAHVIGRIGWYEKKHTQPAGVFARSRPTAISWCEYFCGGVYKRFFLRVAPAGIRYRGMNMGCITLCIHRNYSLNAICEGLFIDRSGRLPFIWYGHVRPGGITLHYRRSVPAFKRGEPYIPGDFGFIKPQPNEHLIPPLEDATSGQMTQTLPSGPKSPQTAYKYAPASNGAALLTSNAFTAYSDTNQSGLYIDPDQ